jgi:N-methylhydantoinase B
MTGRRGWRILGANQSNVPVEMIEQEYPLRVECYALEPDSGARQVPWRAGHQARVPAAGRRRDADGAVGQKAVSAVRAEGRRGRAPSWNIVNPGPEQRVLPVLTMVPTALRQGDVYRHVRRRGRRAWPGLRAPIRPWCCATWCRAMATEAHAREAYGVAVVARDEGWAVDDAATVALRGG